MLLVLHIRGDGQIRGFQEQAVGGRVEAAQRLEEVAIHKKAKSIGDRNGIVIDRTQAGGSAQVRKA
jgi:hypothetical protein